MRYLIIFLVTLSFVDQAKGIEFEVRSMETIFELSDTVEVFTLYDLYGFVYSNHPVVKQADLQIDNAIQELRKARGSFDPKLTIDWELKNYKNTEYYDRINTQLKVPVWIPIDPKISVDRNRGQYLNPESFISDADENRQVTAGISLPVGRGLFIDERRAVVRQSRLFRDISEAERIKMINKIFLSAAKDYWSWYFDFYEYRINVQGLEIAEEIYRRVMLDFEFGEASALDTVQAAITLQTRRTEIQQALINFRNSSIQLSNYLWNEMEEPLELSENLVPFNTEEELIIPGENEIVELKENSLRIHPELRKLDLKLSQLDIERKLNVENLKPQLDLNYNFINEPLNQEAQLVDPTIDDNYKFGLNFSIPLYLRKERSNLAKTKIKIDETNYEFDQKSREILNSIDANYIELANTRTMIELQQVAVENYFTLLQGELFNLENGESDLFKINIQQEKLLESQSKLLKMQANFEKVRAQLYWSAGVPYLNFPVE